MNAARLEETPPDMDYAAHVETYRGFLRVTKYGIIATVIILVLMAFFLL